ncbi:MAG: methyl-accepting chemotaxis protein [Desulfovibrio sp.]|jgi:methyl-accepting chemotaxis protein|nr:methyl-accepting chemotaxis protein [Desulfovibrio sp.]
MRLKTKMLLFLVPAIIVCLASITTYNQVHVREQAWNFALQQAGNIAAKEMEPLRDRLLQAQGMLKSMIAALEKFKKENRTDRGYLRDLVAGVAASNRNFVGAWMLWEPNAFDGRDAEFVDNEDYGNQEGRANAYWLDTNGELAYAPSDNYDGEPYYTVPQSKGRMCVMPPYIDEDTPTKIFMSSIVMPLIIDGKFHGVGGIDIELKSLSNLIAKADIYGTGYALLISDTGVVVGSPRMEDVGKNISGILSEEAVATMRGAADSQKQPLYRGRSLLNDKEEMLFLSVPVRLDAFDAPWRFLVALPLDKIMAHADRQFYVSLGVACVGILALLLLVFAVAGSVSRSMQRLVCVAGEVADGNYKDWSDGGGNVRELRELEDSLRRMLRSLFDAMRHAEQQGTEARREADRAQAAARDVEEAQRHELARRQAMHDVAGRMEGVAEDLQATSAVLVEKIGAAFLNSQKQGGLVGNAVHASSQMTDSTRQVAANAEDVAGFAARTQERAMQGADVVNNTIEAFDGIHTSTERIGVQMRELSARTEGIGTIIGVISEIADQTNLLALNAAIEAARAGEAGRGFAVVADEVRKLAEKTMLATRQVDSAISGIQTSMNESLEGVKRAVESVGNTVEVSREARSSLQDIVSLVQAMSSQIQGIASLCQEQSVASLSISKLMNDLDELSKSAACAMEDGSQAAAELPPQAKKLGELVHALTQK